MNDVSELTGPLRAPTTKDAILATLSSRGLHPLHRFGQNFLLRPDVLDHIVDLAEVRASERVLEVGPGLGGLTERILRKGAQLCAVEIDHGLAQYIRELFGKERNFQLIEGDVLDSKSTLSAELVRVFGSEPFKVVSNLPYQISSPFLAALAQLEPAPLRIVVTLQKEVADVLAAKPGAVEYSPLSLVAGLFFKVRYGPKLPGTAFFPAPKVQSQVVILDRAEKRAVPAKELLRFARSLLRTRRKTARSVLANTLLELEIPSPDVDALLSIVGIARETRFETVAPDVLEKLWLAIRERHPTV